MNLNRIKRGAKRSLKLVQYKLSQETIRSFNFAKSSYRPMVMGLLAVKLLTSALPVEAAVQGRSSLSLDDTDPLSTSPLSGAGVQRGEIKLIINQVPSTWDADLITTEQSNQLSISVGKSADQLVQEAIVAEQARLAAAAASVKKTVATKASAPAQYIEANASFNGNYDALLQEYFGQEWQYAKRVAMAESGLNPLAKHINSNGSQDSGLFQINSVHWQKAGGVANLFDVRTNVKVAKQIRDGSGWKAWSVVKSGKVR